MATAPKLAKEMTITYDSDLLMLVTDHTFEVNKEEVDTTTFDDDGWRSFLSDLKDWKISGTAQTGKGAPGANEAGWDELLAEIKSGTAAVAVIFQGTDTGDSVETGTGFLTSMVSTGSVGGIETFTFEIRGVGAIATTQLS